MELHLAHGTLTLTPLDVRPATPPNGRRQENPGALPWVVVRGERVNDGEVAWSFEETVLRLDEAEFLGTWLEHPAEPLDFIEPLLAFDCEPAAVFIDSALSGHGSALLTVDMTDEQRRLAATQWQTALEALVALAA